MESATILTILTLLVGFYMAWNIGANDVSNAMGTSVGSRALTLKRAVFLAAILEFSGAYFVGSNVSQTIQSGLIDTLHFATQPTTLIIGFCAALLGTSVWLQVASFFGWPVSTTHAIVGAILGFGAVVGGFDTVRWQEVGSIALSWIISPVLSGFLSYILFYFLQRTILYNLNPREVTKRIYPFLVFIFFATFSLILIFNGLKNLDLKFTFFQALEISMVIAAIAALISFFLIRRFSPKKTRPPTYTPQVVISLYKAIKHLQRVRVSTKDEIYTKVSRILGEVKGLSKSVSKESSFYERSTDYQSVEKMFVYLQILSASFIAFAHGANDVANAIGPVAAVLHIIKSGTISASALVPSWLLALGGLGIIIGLATWGWRVIETIGRKITELTPTRGFCAEFGAAATILLASKLGFPISTTHCLVGGVIGVGIAGGLKALNLNTVRDIALSWIITLPASAFSCLIFFYILRSIFL